LESAVAMLTDIRKTEAGPALQWMVQCLSQPGDTVQSLIEFRKLGEASARDDGATQQDSAGISPNNLLCFPLALSKTNPRRCSYRSYIGSRIWNPGWSSHGHRTGLALIIRSAAPRQPIAAILGPAQADRAAARRKSIPLSRRVRPAEHQPVRGTARGIKSTEQGYGIILLESYRWKPHAFRPKVRSYCLRASVSPVHGGRERNSRSKRLEKEFCFVLLRISPIPILRRSPAVCGQSANRKLRQRCAPPLDGK
jgi:hypothetical protein